MKYYIFTVPKAGTYLLAKALNFLGIKDSGYHVEIFGYLDTNKLSFKENVETPEKARENIPFVNVLQNLPENSLCFGHLSPLFFPSPILKQYSIVMSIRKPKEVLTSEFVDFRFRRKDVPFVSKENCPNDREAFLLYLKRAIPIQEQIFGNYFEFKSRLCDFFYRKDLPNPVIEIYFNDFIDEVKGPIYLEKMVDLFNIDSIPKDTLKNLHEEILTANNKTKSTGLVDIDRKSFWGSEAEALYKSSMLPYFELFVKEAKM
ncbi:hypothetical protein [Bacillus smithii]|uniref:hypothetical protein n=1 Tax=Bacillus smithii TaxID=1479 RepID=UPI002E1F16F6|nr:hypothetical protein [Bacillus smithii]MED1456800.1 hypothetical protein [Bacillus smithii]